MPSFNYLALDAAGRAQRGQLEAASEAALETALRREGRWLVTVGAVTGRPAGAAPGNRPLKRRVLIEFFLNLGLQLKAGISIVQALGAADTRLSDARLQGIQQDLLAQVQEGRTFSEALAGHPRAFAPLVVNLIRSAEASGRLAEACHQVRDYYEWLDRLVGEARRALTYPAFVLLAALLFVLLMFGLVVPKFAALFDQMNLALPLVTRLVMGASGFLLQQGGWLLLAVAAGVGGWFTAPRWVPGFVRWRDGFKLDLPLFGDVLQLILVTRFTRNLAVTFGAGLPLLEALRLGRELAGNAVLAAAIDDVRAGVEAGRKMHETMARHAIFSPLVVRMVGVGEASGTLVEGLTHVADYYQEELERRIKKRLALLEPLLIVSLIGVVGLVALALVLPIAELMNPR